MDNERVILCGEAHTYPLRWHREPIHLDLSEDKGNVNLKIWNISDKLVAPIPDLFTDLVEIATYVYCADQAVTRGGKAMPVYGEKWPRSFEFFIPVRELEVWSFDDVKEALARALSFLSDDEYLFHFSKLDDPPPFQLYLELNSSDSSTSTTSVEEVVLFSGGLDSLGGAVQETLIDGRRIALVSHTSVPKIDTYQEDLVKGLLSHASANAAFHIPVWVSKNKTLSKEYTQRTRSFLYASLAATVAQSTV